METPLIDLVQEILSSRWLVIVGGVVVAIYLWKIIRSEEGFLFGYGDWIVGKWKSDGGEEDDAPSRRREPAPTPAPRRSARRRSPERELQRLGNVLMLSRVLDGDLAYLMVNDAGEWDQKLIRGMQTIVTGVARVVRPSGRVRCGFFILDEDEKTLSMAVGEGYSGLQRPRLHVEHSCAGRSFITGEPYYCRDIVTDPVYGHSSRGRRDFRSIACVPVRAGTAIFGVLCLDAEEPSAFTQEEFSYLEVFAARLAVFCAFHTLQNYGACEYRPEGGA